MVPASLNDKFVIRFCVCAENAKDEDIFHAYEIISKSSKELFEIIKLEAEVKEKLLSTSLEKAESPLTIEATFEERELEEGKVKPDEGKEISELIKEENDIVDDVVVLDRRKNQKSLRYRRSFFVRMVSDPKFQQFPTKFSNNSNKINRAFSTSSNPTTLQQSRQTSKDSDS